CWNSSPRNIGGARPSLRHATLTASVTARDQNGEGEGRVMSV
ncbi:MAG: hypothetical protein ACI9AD_000001, partial [Nitriliruptoraceae bacterium]